MDARARQCTAGVRVDAGVHTYGRGEAGRKCADALEDRAQGRTRARQIVGSGMGGTGKVRTALRASQFCGKSATVGAYSCALLYRFSLLLASHRHPPLIRANLQPCSGKLWSKLQIVRAPTHSPTAVSAITLFG
jgi:hypothetical protein